MSWSPRIFGEAGVLLTAALLSAAYQWPSPKYDALEAQLFEGTSLDKFDIAALSQGCLSPNGPGASPIAAQWIRAAYHDMATHNVEDGTGGIDASLRFELDRPENVGQGMLDTLFKNFGQGLTKYVSYADIIAMGVVWSLTACSGPIMPFRGGRVDASEAGPAGVPQPQEDLAKHTEKFRLQGFSPAEMISLVACGHTLGGVRNPDFPNIVKPDPTSPTRSVFNLFDTTNSFDHTVVSQYLDGTTRNPLVVTSNTTLDSDLRIFGSDGNATMRSLNSVDSFSKTCATLLERMVNTVPRSVQLTDEIGLLPAKVADI